MLKVIKVCSSLQVPKLSEIRGENRAKQVVEAFRAYKRREFKPNAKVWCNCMLTLIRKESWHGF